MELNVLLSADNNFAVHMGVCITSILENNVKYFDNINIYILDNGISQENIEKIKSLKNKYEKSNYTFFNASFIEDILPSRIRENMFFDNLGISTFGRLFCTYFLDDNIDKILYLDSDIIVNGNLSEFYKTNLENYYCAGSIDIYSKQLKNEIKLDFKYPYINAGVLLINLKKWRLDKIDDKFLNLLNNYPNKKVLHDQTIINIAFKGKIKIVDLKYNAPTDIFSIHYNKIKKINNITKNDPYYSQEEYCDAVKNPIILHLVGCVWGRPWEINCSHPFGEKYYSCKKISPWKNDNVEKMKLGISRRIYTFIIKNMINLLPPKINSYFIKIGSYFRSK